MGCCWLSCLLTAVNKDSFETADAASFIRNRIAEKQEKIVATAHIILRPLFSPLTCPIKLVDVHRWSNIVYSIYCTKQIVIAQSIKEFNHIFLLHVWTAKK